MITVQNHGTNVRFEEQIYRQIKFKQHVLTLQVVKPITSFSSTATIYVKGPLDAMMPLIRGNSDMDLQGEIDRMQKKGLHPVAIAKKELTGEDVIDFIRMLNENAWTSYKETTGLDQMLLQVAQGCELVGIMGYKNEISSRNAAVVEEIRKNGIKIFLLSTDGAEETLTDLNSMKLFQDFNTPFNIVGDTDRSVEDSLKQCLKQIVDKRWYDQEKR